MSASFTRFHGFISTGILSGGTSSSGIFGTSIVAAVIELFGRGFLNVDEAVFVDSISPCQASRGRSGETEFLPFTVLNSSGSGTIHSSRLTQLAEIFIRNIVSVQIHALYVLPNPSEVNANGCHLFHFPKHPI